MIHSPLIQTGLYIIDVYGINGILINEIQIANFNYLWMLKYKLSGTLKILKISDCDENK